MKNFLLALIAVPLMICGCGNSQSADDASAPINLPKKAPKAAGPPKADASSATLAKPEDQAVGTWKVDAARTTIPSPTPKDKAEEAAMRLELKADGTYATTGTAKPDSGKWALKDHKVAFTPAAGTKAPPEMILSDDGSSLSITMKSPDGKSSATLMMVKA